MSDQLDLESLTPGEQFDLEECEQKIGEGLEQFWGVLLSFSKIHEQKLWRGKYKSFTEYCEQRWGITRRRMTQLLNAHEVKTALAPEFALLITNEAQARALADVAPSRRAEVLQKLNERGAVTAKAITEEAKPRGRVERQIILDDVGTPIPDDALPFWNRKQEAQDLLSDISRIKSILTAGRETMDPFYLRTSNATIYDLQTLYQHLLELKPYAVCTQCQGSPSLQPDGCNFCKNTGLISKHQWDTQSMAEVKAMRLKANNARNGKH